MTNLVKELAIKLFGDSQPCLCGGAHQICLKCNVCRAKDLDQCAKIDTSLQSLIDATILRSDACDKDIKALCETANKYHTASVCVNSHYIELVNKLLIDGPKTCTVINFPLGAGSIEAIYGEAVEVVKAGINELDMVHNLAAVLSGDYSAAYDSIERVAILCNDHNVLLKVILETCFLSNEQIIISCLLAKKAGTHFVKTSTGFGSAGATIDNVKLMRDVVGTKIGVKASGGIKTKEQALDLVKAGANRIGASNVTAIVE